MTDQAAVLARKVRLPLVQSAGRVVTRSEPSAKWGPEPGDVLLPEAAIQARIAELGEAISNDYAGLDPVLVGILRGSVVLLADLIRTISIPIEVDWLAISSYSGHTSSGVVRLLKDLDHTITGRHVLLIEDIIDTGLTLNYVLRLLNARRPASLQVCVLLNKVARRLVDLPIDYKGFDIPDVFVVGYGLDYEQRYRNLRDILALDTAMPPV